MATTPRRVIDLTALEDADRAASRSSGGSELHLLRLALDLQIDALLLTLGAAARDGEDEDRHPEVPWRSWLVDDLDLARAMATVILETDVTPSPALGPGLAAIPVGSALDNLVARYESIDQLLTQLLRRPPAGQPWRPAAKEALARCRSRLNELNGHRAALAATSAQASSGRHFLPGELLG
jgi:hypothetical protein